MTSPLKKKALIFRRNFLNMSFPGSTTFWERNYERGGNSGEGSYGNSAIYKSSVLNKFVKEQEIRSVVEFGCGDGNQLSYARYPNYLGLDVSKKAIDLCINRFESDESKSFIYIDPRLTKISSSWDFDLSLSLDVLFHLVEDDLFERHICDLFTVSKRFVAIYAHDSDTFFPEPYTKYRKFTPYINSRFPEWTRIDYGNQSKRINLKPDNPYQCEFFFYQKNH